MLLAHLAGRRLVQVGVRATGDERPHAAANVDALASVPESTKLAQVGAASATEPP